MQSAMAMKCMMNFNGDTAVYLNVEDVVQSVGTEFNVESVSALFEFTNANDYADLAAHLSNVQQPSYGVSYWL